MIRVLVVDDHELVRKGITRMLNDDTAIEVLAEAGSGEEAIDLARKHEPNVVVMDVKMPGIGGIEATRKIVKALPDVRVLALSVYEEEPFPSKLLKAGAAGFLSKGAELDEMLRAIKAVNAGQRYLSAEMARAINSKTEQSSPFKKLSQRELQISMMVANCQKVSEISEVLSLSPKTVNTYRYRVFEKLDISSDVELTHLAVKHGLLGEAPNLSE
jgi:DNA-binding NarL/FixJ family response regulator